LLNINIHLSDLTLVILVIIREIEEKDIDKGFLDVLNNLIPVHIEDKGYARSILQKIKSNSLHKIFVAEDDMNGKITGTTTLLVEPKFINKGIKVGYIEDVAVAKDHEGSGIGSKLVAYVTNHAISIEGCKKVLLYCSKRTQPFYEKLGYRPVEDTIVMRFES
jgi:glucosamine-phosphate N-acetyltransferase